MSILQFQYVLNLAKFQDFETVSEKYFISQSTLNTMVIKFEDEIGFPIFLLQKSLYKSQKRLIGRRFCQEIIIEM